MFGEGAGEGAGGLVVSAVEKTDLANVSLVLMRPYEPTVSIGGSKASRGPLEFALFRRPFRMCPFT